MMIGRRRIRHAAWLALTAILIASFAPTASRVLAASQKNPPAWIEICHSEGITRIAIASDDAPVEPARNDLKTNGDCPLCATHAGSFALPPADAPFVAAASLSAAPTKVLPAAPPPLFIRIAAQPRAPPYTS